MHPRFVDLENLNILTVDQMKLHIEDHGIKCASVSQHCAVFYTKHLFRKKACFIPLSYNIRIIHMD